MTYIYRGPMAAKDLANGARAPAVGRVHGRKVVVAVGRVRGHKPVLTFEVIGHTSLVIT